MPYLPRYIIFVVICVDPQDEGGNSSILPVELRTTRSRASTRNSNSGNKFPPRLFLVLCKILLLLCLFVFFMFLALVSDGERYSYLFLCYELRCPNSYRLYNTYIGIPTVPTYLSAGLRIGRQVPDPANPNFKNRIRILLALTKNQFKHLNFFYINQISSDDDYFYLKKWKN